MDDFDFEELVADMLGISDKEREDDALIEQKFYDAFDMDMEHGFLLTKKLIEHTPKVKAGLSGKTYHAFVSKSEPVMLMKIEAGA